MAISGHKTRSVTCREAAGTLDSYLNQRYESEQGPKSSHNYTDTRFCP